MEKALLVLFLVILLSACKEEQSDISIDPGYGFFPLAYGQYHIYEVEEVTFSTFSIDTASFFLQEKITDSLVSGDGSIRYLLSRYKSQDTLTWVLDSVWTVQRHKESLVVTENNLPLVKLVFPVLSGKTWNGNALNIYDSDSYFYADEPGRTVAGQDVAVSDIIRVVLEDIPENLVKQDERSEVYARGVGLVEKDYYSLNFCSVNCEELGEIQSGRILKQNLIAYGQE